MDRDTLRTSQLPACTIVGEAYEQEPTGEGGGLHGSGHSKDESTAYLHYHGRGLRIGSHQSFDKSEPTNAQRAPQRDYRMS